MDNYIDTRLQSMDLPTDEGTPRFGDNSSPTDVVIWLGKSLHIGRLRCDTIEDEAVSLLARAIKLNPNNATNKEIEKARDDAHFHELRLENKFWGDKIAALPIWERLVLASTSACVEYEAATHCGCGTSVEDSTTGRLGVIHFDPSTINRDHDVQWMLNTHFGWRWAGTTCEECGEDEKTVLKVLGDQMPPYITVADVPGRFSCGRDRLLQVTFRTAGEGGGKKAAMYRTKAMAFHGSSDHFIGELSEDSHRYVQYDPKVGPVALDSRDPLDARRILKTRRENGYGHAAFIVFVRVQEVECEAIAPSDSDEGGKQVKAYDRMMLQEVVPRV